MFDSFSSQPKWYWIFDFFLLELQYSFIDFGTRDTVNLEKLRRLDKQFYKIPKAAVCCGLGYIKPIGTSFSTQSANDFVNMVEDEKVYAKILHIDHSVSIN